MDRDHKISLIIDINIFTVFVNPNEFPKRIKNDQRLKTNLTVSSFSCFRAISR